MFTRALVATLACVTFVAAAVNNTIYIITNAEVPSFHLPGLTPVGLNRVQNCLPPLLSGLNIGLVISCPLDPETGLCRSTLATAQPLATGLGLTVDTTCGEDEETDDDCVTDLIKDFAKTSTKAVLVVWDLNAMDDLFENLDIDDDFGDDDDDDDLEDDAPTYDLFYTVVKSKVTNFVSQNCSGIDNQAPGTFRRRALAPVRRAAEKRALKMKRSAFNSRIVARRD